MARLREVAALLDAEARWGIEAAVASHDVDEIRRLGIRVGTLSMGSVVLGDLAVQLEADAAAGG